MARGVNKVILIGNLGADPEVRYMSNGGAVANVNLATTESWNDRQTGEKQERTEWHRLVFYRKLAEIAGEYMRKGSKIYVEGKLQTRKWQGQDGHDRYTTEVVVNEMEMLDSRGGGTSDFQGAPSRQQPSNNWDQSQSQSQSQGTPPHQQPANNWDQSQSQSQPQSQSAPPYQQSANNLDRSQPHSQPQPQSQSQPQPASAAPASQQHPPNDDFDDDIPF